MDEVIELAEKLSRAMARSRRFVDLRAAEKAVMAEPETVAMVKELEALREQLAEKERKIQPIEPDEKRRLAALEQTVKSDPKLTALRQAQSDFYEMLNLVNERIASALGPKTSENPPQDASEAPSA